MYAHKNIKLLLLICNLPCACTWVTPKNAVKTEITAPTGETLHTPGESYLSGFNYLSGYRCVSDSQSKMTFYPNATATLSSGFSEKETTNIYLLTADGSVRGGVGNMALTASIRSEASLSNSTLKSTAYSTFNFESGSTVLTSPTLTADGVAAQSSTSDIARYFACGDEFISQVALGGRLHIGLEFSFASQEVRNFFEFKVSGGNRALKKVLEDTLSPLNRDEQIEKIKGTVRVIFEQVGGDMEKFEQIKANLPTSCVVLGKVEETGIGKKKAYLEGYESCIKTYQTLLSDYAKKDFPTQFKHKKPTSRQEITQSNYAPLRYYTQSFRQAGYPEFKNAFPKIPEFLVAFLNGELLEYLNAIKVGYSELGAIDSIVNNTAVSSVTDELRTAILEKTGSINIHALKQELSDVGMTIVKMEAALKTCRSKILESLQIDTKPEGQGDYPKSREAIANCKSDLNFLKNRINAFVDKAIK